MEVAAPLAFDAASGQLAIREDGGVHTVSEALTADGFVDVMLDGQDHSSNPRSASFDRALAGITGSTVTGIHLAGGGEDTLVLGSQQVAGGLTVQASGGTVVTQNVAATGPLAIQAPNITINGALQGSSVSLAASGWVAVNAAGRVNSVPGASGGGIGVPRTCSSTAGSSTPTGRKVGAITVQAQYPERRPDHGQQYRCGRPAGQVHISFTGAYVATTAAVLSASSAGWLPGGQPTIDGGNMGHLFSSGRHLATGSVGGAVGLFGQDIVLAGATVDASGQYGGGSVRLGGGVQGGNSAVGNTQTVTVTSASTIRADAQQSGNGGRVSVWADQTTTFAGVVSARGGSGGGPGGFIDLSGQGNLSYGGSADAGARLGPSGTLLLDPKNLTISAAPAGVFPQFDLIDPHPTAGGSFGIGSVLSNGNIVVTNPADNFGGNKAGAVYLFDGLTGALISSLVGSHSNDQVGSGGPGVTLLSNGNYVVQSLDWNGGRGAATWGNGSTGISGTISANNSLIGSMPGDDVGYIGGPLFSVTPLSNGNYLVSSRYAVTWGNGGTGISGTVSADNSLVGGGSVTALSNGNYVVSSGYGATWANGSTGISGTVSADNSLVGTGKISSVTGLSNGNYVVDSPFWNDDRGAVTWGNGSTGTTGTVSAANSLVGSNPGYDDGDYVGGNQPPFMGQIGGYVASGVTPLSNGNYVVASPSWNGVGAVTWGNGSTGTSGTVSAANSLVGSHPGDDVVGSSGVTPLSNGNYVVASPYWNNSRGAATWGNGSTGISGTVSAANSLVGSRPGINGDLVSGDENDFNGVTALSNGNYVVDSYYWNNGLGAATWGNGSTGISGSVSAANSLVGSHSGNSGDEVGFKDVTALSNGNYVVGSGNWNGGRGAATWGNGSTGISGTVSDANSLVGTNPGDYVGGYFNQPGYLGVTPLSNGNYVVDSPGWNGNRGAVTWGDGSTGLSGTVSAANSLVGTGSNSHVTPLSNGNYVVSSGSGATWASGISGQTLDGMNTITPQNTVEGVGSNPLVSDDPAEQSFLVAGNNRVVVGLPDPNLFSYARDEEQSVTVTPQFLTNTLDSGTAVVLQASNDITVNDPITVSAGGNGGALTLQAGRSIVLNASITTDNGA